MDISEKPQFELDVKKLLLKYRYDYTRSTGYDIYHRIFKITELVGKLGLCQENINTGAQAIWDGANDFSNLGRLAKLKEKFSLLLFEIVKNWIDIANILKIPKYIDENPEFPLDTLRYVETIIVDDKEQEEESSGINVLFYIFFLIENISEFTTSCKSLCEVSVGSAQEPEMILLDNFDEEFVYELEEDEDGDEIMTAEEFYLSNLESFLMFIVLMKLIAIKSGIDFEESLSKYIRK